MAQHAMQHAATPTATADTYLILGTLVDPQTHARDMPTQRSTHDGFLIVDTSNHLEFLRDSARRWARASAFAGRLLCWLILVEACACVQWQAASAKAAEHSTPAEAATVTP